MSPKNIGKPENKPEMIQEEKKVNKELELQLDAKDDKRPSVERKGSLENMVIKFGAGESNTSDMTA